MQRSTQSMLVLLVFAAGAIGGLWLYLQPGKVTDTLAQADADLAAIGGNLDALQKHAPDIATPEKRNPQQPASWVNHRGETSGLLLTNLGRERCREVLLRLLASSRKIGNSILLNGKPVQSPGSCRAADNRIEVVL